MTLAILAAVPLVLVAVALAIWLIPRYQVERWRRGGITSEEKLAELGVQARSSITQALGGLALIVTIAISAFQVNAARRDADKTFEQTRRSADRAQQAASKNLDVALKNLDLARQGQVSERFSRAVDQLGETNEGGSPAIDVRAGGLFSLMRIGIESPDHTEPALLVAMTYVTNYRPPRSRPADGCRARFDRQRPDIDLALGFVLHRLAANLKGRDKLSGLRGAVLDGLALDGLNLDRFDLRNVKFRGASLVRAHFRNTALPYSQLNGACLKQADFSGAALQGANLTGASVEGAIFKGAKLTMKDLERSPLSEAQRRQVDVVRP
jgi:hypothetical protein